MEQTEEQLSESTAKDEASAKQTPSKGRYMKLRAPAAPVEKDFIQETIDF
jgi:hypothetical protein